MPKFKVVLEFHYDSDEDISDWNIGDCKVKAVTNADEAMDVAHAELENANGGEFHMNVYDEDGEYLKGN